MIISERVIVKFFINPALDIYEHAAPLKWTKNALSIILFRMSKGKCDCAEYY